MPMKEIIHRLQPIQVYIVLFLSACYFSVQMYISQNSHSITLLVHGYHMLCNIIALSGCIITIKNNDQEAKRLSHAESSSLEEFDGNPNQKEIDVKNMSEEKKQQRQHERSLKNTFGWARVDVLTMVIVCTFLAALCFSGIVEVIQTVFHITHNDHVEHQGAFHTYAHEICIILGAIGLILNGISYLLIGGYTYHQGSFLHLTADGNVYILDRVVDDGRKVSDSKETKDERKSKKIHEMARDVCSAVLVIICSTIIVFCGDQQSIIVRLIDPIMALVSIIVLITLSYPYMKEAASILLQTIPDSIDIEDFQKEILKKFPQISSIHDLHIWQLTQEKYVSTVHIIFQDSNVYKTINNDVIGFFHEQGINIVTIQPEFLNLGDEDVSLNNEGKPLVNMQLKDLCLMACRAKSCEEKLCCRRNSEHSAEVKTTNDVQLEQVISVHNISAEELNTLTNFTSVKSLISSESAETSHCNLVSKKFSSASLNNPTTTNRNKGKLQKATSVIDHEDQKPITNANDEIHLVTMKKFDSESVIKSGEHDDLGRQNSEIFVENRLQKQLNTTDNNEMEDLREKCDKESS